jgi:hypothetical protein
MTMSHPAEGRLWQDPNGTQPPKEPEADGAWLEARIPAVFAAALATWVLIVAWKALRHLMW